MSKPFLVAVDFDGTIVDHHFPEVGEPAPGAFEWMKRWQEAGARVMLWTMRSDGREGEGMENGPVLSDAVAFCANHGVCFWGINENPVQKSWTKSPKMYAHCYVDDAAFGCPTLPGPRQDSRPWVDWSVVGPAVLEMIRAHNAPRAA